MLGVRGCHSISWRPCSRSSSNPPDAPGQSQAQSTPTDVGCPTKSNQRQSSPTPRMSGQLSYIKEWTAPRAPVPSPAFRVVLHHELRCRGPHFRQWTIFPPGGRGRICPSPSHPTHHPTPMRNAGEEKAPSSHPAHPPRRAQRRKSKCLGTGPREEGM